MRNAEELFNDYIDFDTCTYTNEELKKDAILAMEAYAKEYHESKVKTLALPVVINWVAVKDRLPKDKTLVLCARTETSMSGAKRISPTTGMVKNGRFSCEWDWINVDYWAELPQPPCL